MAEVEQESESVKPRRAIYLLPNLFTTAALFSGFYAVIAANVGHFENAALAIFVAMILDGMDGRVARLTNTQSEFGVQFDSLADMVSFGVAPALVMFEWILVDMKGMGPTWGKLGWIGAFTYTACAALRLARFNTMVGVIDKRYFQGLPSPAAAAVMASLVWVGDDLGARGLPMELVAWLVTVAVALLMVSNIKYYSFKEFDFRYRVPFVVVVAIALGIAIVSLHATTLFLAFLVYAASGPALALLSRHRPQTASPVDDGE